MTVPERLTLGFYNWELRGRGWHYFTEPVQLEPPFYPFSHTNHLPNLRTQRDDGKVPTLFEKFTNLFTKEREVDEAKELDYELIPYHAELSHNPVEFQLTIPQGEKIEFNNQHELLLMLASTRYPVSFEIIGTSDNITVQIVCDESESVHIHEYIKLFLPRVIITKQTRYIDEVWDIGICSQIVYLALEDEFMRPLVTDAKPAIDPLTGLYATLEQVQSGEMALLQVVFQGTKNAWQTSIMRSVTDFEGRPFFVDDETMLPLAKEKVSAPLFGVSIRLVAHSGSDERNRKLLDGMCQGLINQNRGVYNQLTPMVIKLPYEDQSVDIIMRTSHVLGMLLNSKELATFVHVPFASVQASKLHKNVRRTKLLPSCHSHNQYSVGINEHYGTSQSIGLTTEERLRHLHVIGSTGSGKSNLFIHLIGQDIEKGNGCCVIDPHGDLIDSIIGHIPEQRLQDVILIDPSDVEYSIGLNLLSATSYHEQMVLESDLVSVFKRQSTSWGDQMTSVLSNAINAFLESSKGGTLLDVRRFLVDTEFRNAFLKTVSDETIHTYWKHEFPVLKNNSIAPILTRLDTFLRPKVIRSIMQKKRGIDFADVMNNQKILLVKLSHGLIGEQNSHLLGTLIISKINQVAQARQHIESTQRVPFYLYIDEFQNYITDSLSSILSGARKYGLGLILAHQSMEQVFAKDKEVAESLLSNPYTRICFRLGDSDAKKLENSFASFESYDLQNLNVGNAIIRIGQSDHDGTLTIPEMTPSTKNEQVIKLKSIRDFCKEQFAEMEEETPIVEHVVQETKTIGTEKKDIQDAIVVETEEEKPPIEHVEEVKKVEEDFKTAFIQQEEKRKELRQHQFLQNYIKKTAEGLGFKSTLEAPTSDGGRIDVVLSNESLQIAVEISVTNTVSYELQNIHKCFNNGYMTVYMISEDAKHLRNIREQAILDIPKQYHSQLHFLTKDECVEQLQRLVLTQQQPTEMKIRGYKVKVSTHQTISANDHTNLLDDIVKGVRNKKD
ncbi:MAG: type IV secretion system DNA-binding domain-containing protein [Chitinophagales bacterium]|nr:type IV secretion system DNA-binding domain-containing protein [Chitinophagales bacterium]